MIENDKQLERSKEYLKSMEEIVANMRKENIHPKRLKMWLEPYLHEVHKTRLEIKKYLENQKEEQ